MVLAVNFAVDLSKFFSCLLNAHTKAYHARHNSVGRGLICQGRFKSLNVKDDDLIAACRYVERNPLAAGLVNSTSEWPWSSHCYWLGIERFAVGPSLRRPFTEEPSIWQTLTDAAMTTGEIGVANGGGKRAIQGLQRVPDTVECVDLTCPFFPGSDPATLGPLMYAYIA